MTQAIPVMKQQSGLIAAINTMTIRVVNRFRRLCEL
jgi:hypothetical protein